MEMTLNEAVNMRRVLMTLKGQPLPIKTAYKMAKLDAACEEESLFFEEKMREIIQKYSEKNSDGSPILTEDRSSVKIEKEYVQECQDKIKELSELVVQIADYSFTLDELAGLDISVDDIKLLMPLIKEGT